MAATMRRSHWGGVWARLLALILAVLLALVAFVIWTQIQQEHMADPTEASRLPEIGMSQAVSDCVTKRVGDIDRMVGEGMMTHDAGEEAKQDARSLCVQRN